VPASNAKKINFILLDEAGNTIVEIEQPYQPFGISTGGTFIIPQAMDASSIIVWNAVMFTPYRIDGDCKQTHLFNDGRLDQDSAYQSVALYCDGSTLIAYAMFESKGYLAFKITQAEIDKFPKNPARNILIKVAKGVRLYRLSSGELQINRATEDDGEYSFILTSCVH
jgi:hypothetical protein